MHYRFPFWLNIFHFMASPDDTWVFIINTYFWECKIVLSWCAYQLRNQSSTTAGIKQKYLEPLLHLTGSCVLECIFPPSSQLLLQFFSHRLLSVRGISACKYSKKGRKKTSPNPTNTTKEYPVRYTGKVMLPQKARWKMTAKVPAGEIQCEWGDAVCSCLNSEKALEDVGYDCFLMIMVWTTSVSKMQESWLR